MLNRDSRKASWFDGDNALFSMTCDVITSGRQRRSNVRQSRRMKIRQIDEGTSLSSSWPPDESAGDERRHARELRRMQRLPQVPWRCWGHLGL